MTRLKGKYLIVAMIFLILLYIGGTKMPVSEGTEKVLGAGSSKNIEEEKKHIVGYYPAWKSYSGYTPDKIDANKVTHINYAFANIGTDLKIEMGYPDKDERNFEMLNQLKKTNPDLKILISVGGWNWSGRFSEVAATEETRATFADSCIDFISKYGLDGIDLDWEYPVGGGFETNSSSPDDKQNFTFLLKEIREKLDAQGIKDNRYYMLTIAAGASNYYINNTEVDKFHKYLDYVNLMTYDINGPWDPYSDFNAPLYKDESSQYKICIDSSVNAWLDAGLPRDKLVVGIPFYGYRYHVPNSDNKGLHQKHINGDGLSYHSIVEDYLNDSGYTRNFHEESLVPWLYNGDTFISYEDPQSILLKAEYIKNKNLRGAMVWELSQDSDGELLNSLYKVLHNPTLSTDYQGHWAEDTIDKWIDLSYVSGYPDGRFKPEDFITRAEFIKMVNNLFAFTEQAEIEFIDLDKDSWYYEEIQKAYKAEYIRGVSEIQFAPNAYITREQTAVIISRLLDLGPDIEGSYIFNDSDKISTWAKEHVGVTAKVELIKGYEDNSFKPQNNIKRAEALDLLDRVLKIKD